MRVHGGDGWGRVGDVIVGDIVTMNTAVYDRSTGAEHANRDKPTAGVEVA